MFASIGGNLQESAYKIDRCFAGFNKLFSVRKTNCVFYLLRMSFGAVIKWDITLPGVSGKQWRDSTVQQHQKKIMCLAYIFFLTNNSLFMVDQNPRLHDKSNIRHQEVNVLWFHCSSWKINDLLVCRYIDQGRNPQLYTKDCLEKALEKNQQVNGKIDAYKVCRNSSLFALTTNYSWPTMGRIFVQWTISPALPSGKNLQLS